MEPITAALGIIGLGTSLFGGMAAANTAKQQAQVSQQISGVEQQEDQVRQQAMQVQARRSQLEVVRNTQRARAMSIQAGTNQGAQLGSGVQGGMAETTNEGLFGLQGINQNVQASNTMFGLNSQISGLKGQLAGLGGQEATEQGIASLGGAIMKAGPFVGQLSQGMGGFGSSVFKGLGGGGGMFFNG